MVTSNRSVTLRSNHHLYSGKLFSEILPFKRCFNFFSFNLNRGRGEHPKMGKVKGRIEAEDVIINIGKEGNIFSN